MFISNKTLVSEYLNKSGQNEDLLQYFLILKEVIRKYGKKFLRFDAIKDKYPGLFDLGLFLKKFDKLNFRNISQIIKNLQDTSTDASKNFEIKTNIQTNKLEKVNNYIKTKFENSNIHTQKSDKTGIDIKGSGFYYKRNLDSDLDKLL